MKLNQKLKTFAMSSALAGVLAAAPMAAHAQLGHQILHQGMTSKDVQALQQQLKDFDYYQYRIDGIYGPITFEAVSAFQFDYGLLTDGIFGSNTLGALEKVESFQQAYQDAPLLSQGDRGEKVKDLQNQLKLLNYYKGAIDGIFGPITEAAVQEFQKANHIAVDGIAGPQTYAALIRNPVRDMESGEKVAAAESVSRDADNEAVRTFYVESTAYTANCDGCSGITATGIDLNANPDAKVVAVDPDVIPLGSTVWVEGYGYAVAGDVGGGIDGKEIDVFFQDRSTALDWGVQTVKVKVFE